MNKNSLGLKLLLALAGVFLLGAAVPVQGMPAPPWSSYRVEKVRDGVGNPALVGGRVPKSRARIIGASVPIYGTVRLLAIPIEFQQDANANTSGNGQFPYKSWGPASQPGYLNTRIQQLSAYYGAISGGRVNLVITKAPTIRLPEEMSYYAQDANIPALMADAILVGDNQINFALYDSIMLIHAGAGMEIAASANAASQDIWSHMAPVGMVDPFPTNDGVLVGSWCVVPETQCSDGFLTQSNPGLNIIQLEQDPTYFPDLFVPHYWDVQGVWAHELGHTFGLPDLYDTGYSGGTSLDAFSLMGAGSWLPDFPWGVYPTLLYPWLERYEPTKTYYASVPCHPDAWCKAFLGWSTVCNVTTPRLNERIRPQEGGLGWIYRMWTGGDPETREYFLLENRYKTGYDLYIPGSGLMIYHIDDNIGSIALNDVQTGLYPHPRINPVPSDGNLLLVNGYYIPTSTTPFPIGSNHLGDFTIPRNSNSYAGDTTAVDISNIHWDGVDIIANLRTSIPQPIVFTTPQANEILYVTKPTVRVSTDNLTGITVMVNGIPIINFTVETLLDEQGNPTTMQRISIPLGPLTTGMYTVEVSGVDITLGTMKSATLTFWVREKTLPGGLTTISLPVMGAGADPIGDVPTVFLGSTTAQLAWWNPLARANVFYPDPQVELSAPEWTAAERNSQPPVYHPPAGRGFWAKLSSQNVLQLLADVLPQDRQYTLRVEGTSPSVEPYQGFTMIGTPYSYPVGLGSVLVDYGGTVCTIFEAVTQRLIDPVIYNWNGTNYIVQQLPTAVLEPWIGYWVHVNADTTAKPLRLIFQPIPARSFRTPVSARSAGSLPQWELGLRAANTQSAAGARVTLGVMPGATAQMDFGSDLLAPPTPQDGVSLVSQAGTGGAPLMRDYRAQTAGGTASWNLTVSGPAGSRIVVSWPDLTRVPKDLLLTLRDTVTGAEQYMRSTARYTVTLGPQETQRSLQLIAAPGRIGALQILNLKTQQTKAGGGALVTCQVTMAADLTMEVRTMTGRLVKAIPATPARSLSNVTLVWDGKDANGRLVPRGMYQCQVIAVAPTGQKAKAVTIVRP
ncbi:MAG: M6 family metalloprotease domain-containing protein [Armatimonadota bacterium]